MAGKKPQRRNAFEGWQAVQQAGMPTPPPSPLDQMPVAATRQRNRGWEKEHKARPYRGVPVEVHKQVIALATHLQVNTDEVVQVFVQYGLSCLEKGILKISPLPKAQRMTLFPLPRGWGDQAGWSEADGWTPGKTKEIPTKRIRPLSNDENEKLWQYAPGYRLSDETHAAVKYIADQHTVPIGEIMTLFLKHGLESYKNGRLILNPQPRVVKMTLTEGVS